MYALEDVIFMSSKQFMLIYETLEHFKLEENLLKLYKDVYKSLKFIDDTLPTVSVGERPSVAVSVHDLKSFKTVFDSVNKDDLRHCFRIKS